MKHTDSGSMLDDNCPPGLGLLKMLKLFPLFLFPTQPADSALTHDFFLSSLSVLKHGTASQRTTWILEKHQKMELSNFAVLIGKLN